MEYLLLIIEFFYVKGIRNVFWSLVVPAIIGILVYFCSDDANYIQNASSFQTNVVTVIGILIGFTISTLTMLLTVSHPNIEKAKAEKLGKKLFSKELTLFDSVQIGLAYLIIVQGFLIIANFIYPAFIVTESSFGKKLFAISVSILVHIILILMRNILDFYFILSKK